MKRIIKISNRCILLFLLFFHGSCTIDTALPPSKKQLVIACDFLTSADSVLFEGFANEHKISVQLEIMSSSAIRYFLEEKKANSGIDIVLSKSLLSVSLLDKRKLLQSIDFSEELPDEIEKFNSWKYNYVGIGINPFVIAPPITAKGPKKYRTYDELIAGGFINKLDRNHSEVFLAPYMYKMKKVDANKKIRSFVKHSQELTISDSLNKATPILIDLHRYNLEKGHDSLLFNREITYPNQLTSGSFYDIINVAIVDQAEHFTEAKSFLNYFTDMEHNKQLNKKLGTLSIYSAEEHIRIHTTNREKLIPYMGMVERILKKLNYRNIN